MATDLTSVSFWESKHDAAARPKVSWLRRRARRRLDGLLRAFTDLAPNSGSKLLEIGCSPGRMLERIHMVRPDVQLCGIDYSQEGVRSTRQWLREANIRGEVFHGDMRSMELPTKYDLVCSFGLLEHFDDPASILRHHARFCAPGGHVAVLVPNYSTVLVKSLIRAFDPKALESHSLAIMNTQTLACSMKEAGLGDVRSGTHGAPRFRSASAAGRPLGTAYRNLATAWNAGVSCLPFDFFWQSSYWVTGRVNERKLTKLAS